MYDSHTHLHGERMVPDADAAIARAQAAGVCGFMLAGVDPEDWHSGARLSARHPSCALSYGVHPQLAPMLDDDAADRMVAALADALAGRGLPTPHALGEIGLDRATPERVAVMARQEHLFRAQLALARAHDLPVLLHILHAHGPALELLRRDGLPRAGGVVHSYSGSAELVRDYTALGLHVSFAGYVTRPTAKKMRQAAVAVPLDRLLVETDAPDQTPLPHHPAPNEPAFLPLVVSAVAALRGATRDAIAVQTEANARRLFRL